MSLIENKHQIFSELKERLNPEDAEISMADSILIRRIGLITKIPMQRCAEEVFILRKLKDLGIPTIEITDVHTIKTRVGIVSSYTMREINGAVDLIRHGNKFLNDGYYLFLKKVFVGLQKTHFDGFGAIELTSSNIKTEYGSDKELLRSILHKVEARGHWPSNEMGKLKDELEQTEGAHEAILAHTDILHNILVDRHGKFYLIDPQTIISAANKYWDLTYYLIYANGYDCTFGLAKFLKQFNIIDDWNLFLITAKINAYERTSFYAKYDPSKLPGMINFLEGLKLNHIRIGNKVLTKTNL
jgi:hypothetical protein